MRLWALGQLETSKHDEPEDDEPNTLEAAAAGFGLLLVEPDEQETEEPCTFWLWPDTLELWDAWHSVQTQWIWVAGFAGAQRTGLEYSGVTAWLQANGWRKGRARNLREGLLAIQSAERAALTAWDTLRLKNQKTQKD